MQYSTKNLNRSLALLGFVNVEQKDNSVLSCYIFDSQRLFLARRRSIKTMFLFISWQIKLVATITAAACIYICVYHTCCKRRIKKIKKQQFNNDWYAKIKVHPLLFWVRANLWNMEIPINKFACLIWRHLTFMGENYQHYHVKYINSDWTKYQQWYVYTKKTTIKNSLLNLEPRYEEMFEWHVKTYTELCRILRPVLSPKCSITNSQSRGHTNKSINTFQHDMSGNLFFRERKRPYYFKQSELYEVWLKHGEPISILKTNKTNMNELKKKTPH